MYVCPHCHEEIPDRVRRTQSECPFCREPWPPEEQLPPEQESPGQAAQAQGPQAQAAQPAAQVAPGATPAGPAAESAAAAEPPKSKTGMIIAIVAVLLVAAGGLWWWHSKKGGKSTAKGVVTVKVGDEKVTLKEYYEDDYANTLAWYDAVRKQMVSFLEQPCEDYQRHRFHVISKLVERERLLSEKKKVKDIRLDVTIDSKAHADQKGFNWFKCPFILAYVQKEHAMTIQVDMTEKERVLGSTIRRAVITISGGRFVQGKGTYKSNWDNNRAGLFFPMLKKLDPKKNPGVAVLSGKKVQSKPPKHFVLGGVEFTKVKKLEGKSYLAARWKARLQTDKFIKLFREWTGACQQLKRSVKEANDQYADKEMRVPALKTEAAEAARKLCRGLTTVATGIEPWDESKVHKGAEIIDEAFQIVQDQVRKPLMDLAKAVGSSNEPKPLCGPLKSPTPCKKK